MLNALTIDVEDYYHVKALSSYIRMSDWDILPARVETNTMKILEILDRHKIKATFFVLGCVAKKKRNLVRSIHKYGHEVACHGYSHQPAYAMTPDEFRNDIRKAKSLLEDCTGSPVKGYRAASFSIKADNLWCLDILIEEGFQYDSSIFPIYRSDYGIPSWNRFPHLLSRESGDLYSLPPATVSWMNGTFPVAGGAYLRFLPLSFIAGGIRRINRVDAKPAIVYMHPWEIDVDQPRLKVNKMTALRHYSGIDRLKGKLERLFLEFEFGTASAVIENSLPC